MHILQRVLLIPDKFSLCSSNLYGGDETDGGGRKNSADRYFCRGVIFRPVGPTHYVPRPGAKVMHVISEGVGIKYLYFTEAL
jgi:hypothetical protein